MAAAGARHEALEYAANRAMCIQCMMGAMTATASATGIRAWLAQRDWNWLTPRRLRRVTALLIAAALVVSAVGLGGSGG
jgi:hypothetical protein